MTKLEAKHQLHRLGFKILASEIKSIIKYTDSEDGWETVHVIMKKHDLAIRYRYNVDLDEGIVLYNGLSFRNW